MLLYRIGRTKYARDLTGEGARLNGGRWNHEDTPCIYTAESRALSLLEFSAHASLDSIPRALSFTTLRVPEGSIKEITIDELPGNWKDWPHPKQTRDFGTKLLNENKYLILKIPSAIIPDEFNYIINTFNNRMKDVKIVDVQDYVYDVRLKM
jgi:RES domain-containing protein